MQLSDMYLELGISPAVFSFGETVLRTLEGPFREIDRVAEWNQAKVLRAFQKNRIGDECFSPTSGYGYNDVGRGALDRVYSDVFRTEAALVRPQITCGTHALALGLAANLRPGDVLLSPAGHPYDTLEEVIGIRASRGSLAEHGVSYREVGLREDGSFDYPAIRDAVRSDTRMALIQRSRGYDMRQAFSVRRIGELIAFLKEIKPDLLCMVDNCYGEFVEPDEPGAVGADLVAGSLIKNPGGGLAVTGGYVCGTKECVEQCSCRLTAPGLGAEVGATLGTSRLFLQGLFLAPAAVASALKGAVFVSGVYERLGFRCVPSSGGERHDIIEAVELGSPEAMLAFCGGIQQASPVDSHVTPVPWPMPGYDSEVLMAAGTFVQGSSIELSADGPVRPPYAVYYQGGLTWPHAKIGVLKSVQRLIDGHLAELPPG